MDAATQPDGERGCGRAEDAVEGSEEARAQEAHRIANMHEAMQIGSQETRRVAQIELTSSNAREPEPVPVAVERAVVVRPSPVRDPGRPASPDAKRLEPEPDPCALAKRPRVDRPPPTSQVGERDEVEARIVKMLDELFHDDCAGGCDCEECDPEEEGHEEDCDCALRPFAAAAAPRAPGHSDAVNTLLN